MIVLATRIKSVKWTIFSETITLIVFATFDSLPLINVYWIQDGILTNFLRILW